MHNLQIHNAKCKLLHRCVMLVCLVSFRFSGESRECPLRSSLFQNYVQSGCSPRRNIRSLFQINFRDVSFSIYKIIIIQKD